HSPCCQPFMPAPDRHAGLRVRGSAIPDSAPPLRKKVVSSQRTTKAKARRSHSLPLLTYSRLGVLRQAPGRSAESAAGPRTDEDMGVRRACDEDAPNTRFDRTG